MLAVVPTRWRNRLLVGITALGWVAAGAACDHGGARPPGAARRTALEQVRIGYAVEAPYAFVDGQGRVTGESVEVARHVAEVLGIRRVVWVQTEFGRLVPELLAGRFDVVAAGMFITPERARRVAFSEPTFHVRQGLLVRRGNPLGIHAYEDAIAREGLEVAVLTGSVEEGLLRRMGLAERRLVRVPDATTGRAAVETGAADALALSALTLRRMAAWPAAGETEIVAPFRQPRVDTVGLLGYGAFAFRPADRPLRERWNQVLARYVGSPEHRTLLVRFGFTDEDLPGLVRTADLLASVPREPRT